MAEFNEISRIDSYLESLAKVSRWVLSLSFAILVLSISSSHDYIFQNISIPKRATFIALGIIGMMYAFLTGQYISKIRMALHLSHNRKELVKAIVSHGSMFNMFYQTQRNVSLFALQSNVINIVFLVIIYAGGYFYYADTLPRFYDNLSSRGLLEIMFGVVLMFSAIFSMNKWSMRPAYIVIRESAPTKEEGRKMVVRMLKQMGVINLSLLLLVAFCVLV
ncbi:MAG: hypothetical protein GXP11_10500 [Gammaproteobacteria bacterium]|nr:hypothetical protein [Gammaproteobacteria bacterium]